jgi:uncharacterized protein (DUF1778 family)
MATSSEIRPESAASRKTNDRINCRVSPAIKQRAEEAAHLLGQSITAFTESALAEKAQQVLADHEKIVLSERDFERFVEIITNPSPPTPALVRAMREYEAQRDAEPDGNW